MSNLQEKQTQTLTPTKAKTSLQDDSQNAVAVRVKDFWKVIVAGAGAFSVVATAGFSFGVKYEESVANEKFAELKGAAEQVQTKFVAAQEKITALSEANVKYNQAYNQLTDILNAKNSQIERLSAQVSTVNNCAFIHEQIKTLEHELTLVGHSFYLLGGGAESETKQQTQRNALEQRIAGYQLQLGPGACK